MRRNSSASRRVDGGKSTAKRRRRRAERARGEKRVRNDRIKSELGVELLFPTYREGLAAIAEGNRTPFGADGGGECP